MLEKSKYVDKERNQETLNKNVTRNISCSSKQYIKRKYQIVNNNEKLNCEPHISHPEACKYAESLYLIDPSLYKCNNNRVTTEICKVIGNSNEENFDYQIQCRIPSECHQPGLEPTFYVLGLNKKTGRIQEKGIYYTTEELEIQLTRYIRKAQQEKSHFLFLDCNLVSGSKHGKNPSQLLYFPPGSRHSFEFTPSVRQSKIRQNVLHYYSKQKMNPMRSPREAKHVHKIPQSLTNHSHKLVKPARKSKLEREHKTAQSSSKQPSKSSRPYVNVNVILLDSVSRAHFYRSLPSTIAAFNEINSNKTTEAEVLDFELFQSVHGHSAENIHALFSGSLNPDNMADDEREKIAAGVNNLYEKFKQAGYHTVYQDDLCWTQWWGMRMELGSPTTWKEFSDKIKNSFIDDTGMLSIKLLKDVESIGIAHPVLRKSTRNCC